MRLPKHYAAYIFGVIQAAITTGIATAIAMEPGLGGFWHVLMKWLTAWCVAWLTVLPIVIFIAPFIRRAVDGLTVSDSPAEDRPN